MGFSIGNRAWRITIVSEDVCGNPLDISSAEDLFRRAFGNFAWVDDNPEISSHSSGDYVGYFTSQYSEDMVHDGVKKFRTYKVGEAHNYATYPELITNYSANPTRISVHDRSTLTPNIKIPFRLFSNREHGIVKGDDHWRTFFMGGEWGGESFPQRFNRERVYYDLTTAISFPCSERFLADSKYTGTTTTDDAYRHTCTIKSNYNHYNHNTQQYQDWASEVTSELLLPNTNIVAEYYYNNSLVTPLSTKIQQASWSESKASLFAYHFPVGDYYSDLKKDQYFGTYFPTTNSNEQYKQAALQSQQNLLFDHEYFKFLKNYDTDDSTSVYKTIAEAMASDGDSPNQKLSTFYNMEIEFDRDGYENDILESGLKDLRADDLSYSLSGFNGKVEKYKQPMRSQIEGAGFSSRFLELLKDLDNGAITEINRKNMPFRYVAKKYAYYQTDNGLEDPPWASSWFKKEYDYSKDAVGLKSCNLLNLLIYAYNNPEGELNDDYTFIGPIGQLSDSNARAATRADDNLSRLTNNQGIIELIWSLSARLKFYLKEYHPDSSVRDWSDLSANADDVDAPVTSILRRLYGPTFHGHEVLAYKIEKIGGTPSGDGSNQQVLQKFWVYNSTDAAEQIKILDSQVKYGRDYTYKISAYAAIVGHKYKYDDLRLTKQIGRGNYLGTDGSAVEYCLQFYNPFEDNAVASQLFAESDYDATSTRAYSTMLSSLNEKATNSVEISNFPYLADFNLILEPCVELVEIPFFEKTIRVMDHPSEAIRVTPFHFIDNSNRIGFQIAQDSFIKRPYPILIKPEDLIIRDQYLNSKLKQPYNLIDQHSESPARYIEMYRTKNKPNSFVDFMDALVATIDLRIENDSFNYANKILSDQINTNTKYYYLFRYLNENRIPGQVSQIIEAELVNDGGYTYAIFDSIDSSEFNPNKITAKEINFKKMIQIAPSLRQLKLNTNSVNYSDYAANQLDNVQVGGSLWNKKFKIRLTSKKTGRKMDLNITHNLLERDLTKATDMIIPPDPVLIESPPTSSELDDASVTTPFEETVEIEEASMLEGLHTFGEIYAREDDFVDIDEDYDGDIEG